MSETVRKKVLLLGAGFSANFGAPLAKDIWLELFNCHTVQNNIALKECLINCRGKYDFETFYHEIISVAEFDSEVKNCLIQEVNTIFKDIDLKLETYIKRKQFVEDNFSIQKLLGFLLSFSIPPLGRGRGCIFSLNQDILVERLCHDFIHQAHSCDGVRLITPGPFDAYGDSNFDKDRIVTKQEMDEGLTNHPPEHLIGRDRNELLLFKLHGSYNWKFKESLDTDIADLMVIGRDKSNRINKFPLLQKYMDIFKKILSEENIDLIIIGYSFSDTHINQIINSALENKGLKLFNIDIKDLQDWETGIEEKLKSMSLTSNLRGYLNKPLKEIFKQNLQDENLAEIFSARSNLSVEAKSQKLIHSFKNDGGKLSKFLWD